MNRSSRLQRAHANVPAAHQPTGRATEPDPAVELSSSQLNVIRIEPAGVHRFDVEKEGVGNIDFDEDLTIVQAESALVGAAATFELTGKALARVRDLYSGNGGVPQKELEQRSLNGLNSGDITSVIRAALGGASATTILEAERQFDVAVRYPAEYRDSIDKIRNVRVAYQTSAGAHGSQHQTADRLPPGVGR